MKKSSFHKNATNNQSHIIGIENHTFSINIDFNFNSLYVYLHVYVAVSR